MASRRVGSATTDFAALARARGGHGFRATKPGELHAVINEALNVDGPVIVDAVVAADDAQRSACQSGDSRALRRGEDQGDGARSDGTMTALL
jgi:thiamine pyrophosphate-dependent acetolactate synthase large subunit-like protein